MTSPATRRPLPALVALLALLLLTGLVWWRVLHRGATSDTSSACSRTGSSSSPAGARAPSSGGASNTGSTAATATALPSPGAVTVQVLNSTTRAGIASQARTALVSAGFLSPAAAANDTTKKAGKISTTAEIRFGAPGMQGAALLRYYFPGATMVRTKSSSATVIVSLGKKFHAVASTATVQAAMRRDSVAVATPTPTPSASTTPSC